MHISKLLFKMFLLLVVALVVIPCLQKGMFLDGVNYANVANNLANGKGNIWYFTYSDTFLNHYTHQLPFMLWCEALFYYAFGDSTMIERVFCLLLLLLNAFAISKLWASSFPEYRAYFGWPLLLWIITPIVFWGFSNNVQEIMMSLCAIVSVTFMLRYFENNNKMYLLMGGVFCFMCGFCKGVQGLFPLIAIPLYYFIIKPKSIINSIKDQLWFTLPLIVFSSLLWIYKPARQMLKDNFDDRLRSTFVNDIQNTTNERFDLWSVLFMELLVPIGLCLLLYFGFKLLNMKFRLNWQRRSIFFLLIGFSASLPLIVTLEQRRFYLITSIPFFVIALAGIFIPLIQGLKIKKKSLRISNYAITVVTIMVFIYAVINHQSYKRDELMLEDIHTIGEIVAEQTISADSELMFDYSLVAYLARLYNISLDFSGNEKYNFHISQKKNSNQNLKYIGNSYDLQFITPNN